MKKSLKALLLSACVFPGVGYFIVDRTTKGVTTVGLSLVCLYVLIANIQPKLATIRPMVDEIFSGKMAMNMGSIQQRLSSVELPFSEDTYTIAVWLFVILWIGSSIDSYRIGKRYNETKTT